MVIIPSAAHEGREGAKPEQAGPYQESGVLAFGMVVFVWNFLPLFCHGASMAFIEEAGCWSGLAVVLRLAKGSRALPAQLLGTAFQGASSPHSAFPGTAGGPLLFADLSLVSLHYLLFLWPGDRHPLLTEIAFWFLVSPCGLVPCHPRRH